MTRNSFNIYRGLVLLYGPGEAQLAIINRISSFEAELEQELNERLASYLQKDPETESEPDGTDETDAAVH